MIFSDKLRRLRRCFACAPAEQGEALLGAKPAGCFCMTSGVHPEFVSRAYFVEMKSSLMKTDDVT